MADIYDLLVRLRGDGQGLRDDIDQDKTKLDELQAKLDEIKGATAKIDIHDADAQDKIDALKAELDSLKDKQVDVGIDMSEAEGKLADLETQLEAAKQQKIDLGLDDSELEASLTAVEAQLDGARKVTATFHLSDTSLEEQIAQVEAQLAPLDAPVKVPVEPKVDKESLSTAEAELASLKNRVTLKGFQDTSSAPSAQEEPYVFVPTGKAAQQAAEAEAARAAETMPKEKSAAIQQAIQDGLLRNRIKTSGFNEAPIGAEEPYVFEPTGKGAAGAQAQAEELSAELSRVEAQIQELDAQEIDLHGANAKREVEELNLWVDDLRSKLRNLRVNLHDWEALVKADELELKLDGIHDKNVVVTVDEVPAKGTAAAKGGGAGRVGMGALVGVGLGALTGASPMLFGGAGFAAVGATTLKPVFTDMGNAKSAETAYQQVLANPTSTNAQKLAALAKVKEAYAGLDAEQMKVVHSAQSFSAWWKSFTAQFQPTVVNAFVAALKDVQTLIKSLGPAIKGFGQGFTELENGANKAMKAPFWKQFFGFLGSHAKQSTVNFGNAIGGLAKIVAILLKDLYPVGNQFLKLIANLAKLVSTLMTSNPIISTLIHLIVRFATDILQAANGVVKFLTWLQKAHPRIMDVITALGLATAAAWGFSAALDANPVGLVIVALGLLVAGIVEVVKHWKQIVGWLKESWHWFQHQSPAVKLLIAALAPLPVAIGEIISHWKQLKKWGVEAWNALKSAWKDAPTWFKGVWQDVKTAFRTGWDDIKTWVTTNIGHVWAAITKTFNGAINWFRDLWNNVSEAFTKGWQAITKWLGGNLGHVWAAITKVFNGAKKWFTDVWNEVQTATKKSWDDIKKWLSGNLGTVWATVTKIFNSAGKWFTNIWNEVHNATKKGWTDIKTWFSQNLGGVWDEVTKVFGVAETWFSSIWNGITQGITKGWNTIKTTLGSAIQQAVGYAKSLIPGWAQKWLGIGGSTSLPSPTSVPLGSSAGSGVSGTSSTVNHTGTINHQVNGQVKVGTLMQPALDQVSQHLYMQTQRKTG